MLREYLAINHNSHDVETGELTTAGCGV